MIQFVKIVWVCNKFWFILLYACLYTWLLAYSFIWNTYFMLSYSMAINVYILPNHCQLQTSKCELNIASKDKNIFYVLSLLLFLFLSTSLVCILPSCASLSVSDSKSIVWFQNIFLPTLEHQQSLTSFGILLIINLTDKISIGSAVSEHFRSVYICSLRTRTSYSETECHEKRPILSFSHPVGILQPFNANSSLLKYRFHIIGFWVSVLLTYLYFLFWDYIFIWVLVLLNGISFNGQSDCCLPWWDFFLEETCVTHI